MDKCLGVRVKKVWTVLEPIPLSLTHGDCPLNRKEEGIVLRAVCDCDSFNDALFHLQYNTALSIVERFVVVKRDPNAPCIKKKMWSPDSDFSDFD